ncbi:uncharacterized protein RAG0_00745 [Rhynchosporium agropyri]|uniref:Uncharacterized protein n=1 Tax=Rhynchosporium agropyri TaxID=914238 RepID=A0A1E1JUG1_9HELO|nr:uncharacterized protein RAG0_00745 [Rhynchosporium agropyri]
MAMFQPNRITLPVDIWYMVFEELGNSDHQGDNDAAFPDDLYKKWLLETRLVCGEMQDTRDSLNFDATKENLRGQIEGATDTWPSKTSRALTLPKGSLERDAQLSVYQTSYEDFSSMWDFSELCCLSMMSSNFCNFMSSVPIDSLTELRTFYLNATFYDFFDAHDADDEDCRTATAQKFLVSLLESCKHLESLKIESNQWQEILPISSIAKLGTRLRKLRLRSDRSEASLVPKQFLLDTPDLCPDIVNLDLELDVASPSLYGYLSVLTRSKSLSDINPWLQGSTTIDDEVGKQSTDPDYDGAA